MKRKPRPPGFRLTRPEGVDEAKRTLLGGLFLPLAKIAGAGVPFGGAVEGVAEIAKRFRPEDSPEEAGWRLVYAALERAIDDIVKPLRHIAAAASPLPIEHLMDLGGGLDLAVIEAPADFLDQPKALPILEQIKSVLQDALLHLDVDEAAARSAADRLPGVFVFALERTWREHRDGLAALEALTASPIALAARQARHWPYYRAWLEHELEQPLFAGEFSLRQLYQPPRAYRIERQEDARGETKEIRHLVDLKIAFDAWLDTFDANDALRVVTGGPGSGKSSFIKHWAWQVLHRDPPLPTLVVPLHRLDSFDLVDEVGKQAKLQGFARNPLGLDGGERRLLLILDGLDELEADHKTGREAASALVTRVDRLLERNQQGYTLQVVIAGRELIVSALRGELDRAHQIFHVLGYLPIEESEDWQGADELLALDQRRAWWQRWGELAGETLDDAPARIARNEKLAALSDQPLLNHLLAVTRAAAPESLDEASSINAVYATMLDHVWRRSWGDERQLPKLKRLAKEDFQRLFESIGLAVWQHGGGRSTTLEQVAEIARQENLGEQLGVLAEGARETGALDLLTAFYFRREGASDSFELVHKSFGEFFAALRLFRLIAKEHEKARADDYEEAEGLRRWYRWTHAARITTEIKDFLEGELSRLEIDEVRARRATLIRLFDRNLRTGMPVGAVEGTARPEHFRAAQRFDAAAELALLAAIGACSAVLVEATEGRPVEERREIVQWSPTWPDREQEERSSAWDLLRRLEAGTAFDPSIRQCMQGIDLTGQVLRTDLAHAHWSFVCAKSVNLSGAHLSRAHLSGAHLSGAHLFRADLFRANFSDADLSGANLIGADLSAANFSAARLRDANLSSANLSSANLSGAHLIGADLSAARLRDANLSGADLSSADLSSADLYSADLSGANLSSADLRSADLRSADLSGVVYSDKLYGTARGLTRAQLRSARNVDWDKVPDDLRDG